MPTSAPTLGTLLRHLLELLDGDVEQVYRIKGLSTYRPRFTPVMRAVGQSGPLTIREIAAQAGITHSAASQTVSEMITRRLVVTKPGEDARERIVHFTPQGRALYPALTTYWTATNAAVTELSAEIGVDLLAHVRQAIAALEARPFRDRILAMHEQSDAGTSAAPSARSQRGQTAEPAPTRAKAAKRSSPRKSRPERAADRPASRRAR